ncbi:hypothetical protein CCR75_000066 [Bremia lactucae]|uniref:Uncharacterized protein n=1 Tax=Bremia lactucae TaxID=4779 RepID=A0A976FIN7_BRELC|nr:hypothetical protein CCR75_000066 [Bremia lactucae]
MSSIAEGAPRTVFLRRPVVSQTRARLPIPDTNGLVVTTAQDPRIFLVELHRTNIVEMAEQRKETASELVVPYFEFIVIPARYEQGL